MSKNIILMCDYDTTLVMLEIIVFLAKLDDCYFIQIRSFKPAVLESTFYRQNKGLTSTNNTIINFTEF